MRRLTLIVALLTSFAACETPPAPATAPTDSPDIEKPQAKFVVGVRTKTEGPLVRTFPDGTKLFVDRWALVVSAVEIHLCESAWRQFFVKDAWAHVANSTTRLGTPVVEDLVNGTGGAKIVGEIAPPHGKYCRAYAVFTPADEDALNYTPLSAIGHTSVLVGALERPDGTTTAIEWTWDGQQVVSISLDAVAMEADTDQFQLLVDKTISPDLFADLNLADVESGAAFEVLLKRVFERVKLYEAP